MSERPLSSSWAAPGSTVYSANITTMPFPAGAVGRNWHCAAARQGVPPQNNGQYGFFSLTMNIDLKKSDATGVAGPSLAYPDMPLLSLLPKPSSTVLMFDTVFDPQAEVVNASPQFNSVNPANRWRSFAVRHSSKGGNAVFSDGHAAFIATNSILPQQANGNEMTNVDIIWNPLYRAANP